MRSVPSDSGESGDDDRSAKARIRDAAIGCFAELGLADTTARKVATAAGVSPALVMHHFGSMDGLRRACDDFVIAAIRERKEKVMTQGPGFDILGALRDSDYGNLTLYLAKVLMEDSDSVAEVVDHLVDDAEGYFAKGVESGMLRPSEDHRGRVVLMTLWALGGIVMHSHMKRLLGVDLTDPDVTTSPDFINYVRPVMEIVGTGMFTDEFTAQLSGAFASATTPDEDRNEDTEEHDD